MAGDQAIMESRSAIAMSDGEQAIMLGDGGKIIDGE